MKPQLAVIADSANLSQEGKLNVLGVFNTVYAADVPVTHPILWFVAQMEIGAADFGEHDLLLQLVDEEGETQIPPMTAKANLPRPEGYSGDFVYWPMLFVVNNATFPSFGKFIFEMRVDGQIVAEVPVYVQKVDAPSTT